MSIPYQNRRNYRMRSNMTPPPVCNSKPTLNSVSTVHAQTTTPVSEKKPIMPETPPVTMPSTSVKPVTATPVLPNQQPPLTKDISYLRGLYSENVRTILAEIQKEFDRLDYEGSFIYDESPDKNTLFYFALSIYEKVAPQTEITTRYPQGLALKNLQDELERTLNYGQLPGVDSPVWLLELIQVLTYNELIYRRYLNRTFNQ